MSDKPESRNQDLSDLSRNNLGGGKNGVQEYVNQAAGLFNKINLKSLNPQDQQEKSSFIVSELSQQ